MIFNNSSDHQILSELGRRLRRERLNSNLTQRALATQVGVSLKTVSNAEDGQNVSLETLIRLLRGLDRLDELDALLEDPGMSPIEIADRRGRVRQRATGSRAVKDDADGWRW